MLCWNCHEAASNHFSDILKDMVRINRVDLVFIFKPKISGDRAPKAISKPGFLSNLLGGCSRFFKGDLGVGS